MATHDYTSKDISRFWSKVNKDGSIPPHCPELGQCWEWIAGKTKAGYGQFIYNRTHLYSHRVSWELCIGNIADKLHVLHKCDNPKCCNPSHLFLGTPRDNMRDCMNKKRHAHGEKHGMKLRGELQGGHKLTWEKVNYIRQRYAQGGISQRALAREMNISQRQILSILHRDCWK